VFLETCCFYIIETNIIKTLLKERGRMDHPRSKTMWNPFRWFSDVLASQPSTAPPKDSRISEIPEERQTYQVVASGRNVNIYSPNGERKWHVQWGDLASFEAVASSLRDQILAQTGSQRRVGYAPYLAMQATPRHLELWEVDDHGLCRHVPVQIRLEELNIFVEKIKKVRSEIAVVHGETGRGEEPVYIP
jgi:hypothetical protein